MSIALLVSHIFHSPIQLDELTQIICLIFVYTTICVKSKIQGQKYEILLKQ